MRRSCPAHRALGGAAAAQIPRAQPGPTTAVHDRLDRRRPRRRAVSPTPPTSSRGGFSALAAKRSRRQALSPPSARLPATPLSSHFCSSHADLLRFPRLERLGAAARSMPSTIDPQAAPQAAPQTPAAEDVRNSRSRRPPPAAPAARRLQCRRHPSYSHTAGTRSDPCGATNPQITRAPRPREPRRSSWPRASGAP